MGRERTYNEQIAPLIHEAGKVGLDPGEVNGILGANIAPSSTPQPARPSFEEGRVYRDAKGNTAKYVNGQWVPQ